MIKHRFLYFSLSELEEMADVVEHHQLLLKIEKAFPECDEDGCLKIYENILRCVGNKRYVSQHVFFLLISISLPSPACLSGEAATTRFSVSRLGSFF